MPIEMEKLRLALTARDVEYEDLSDDFDRSFPFFDMTIYKTRFKYNGHTYDVISGVGTQGGERGLLELRVDQGEPIGNITHDYVISIMLGGKPWI